MDKSDGASNHHSDLVTFGVNDPEDPVNWSSVKKLFNTSILCVLAFTSVFGSSSYAPGQGQIMKQYHVSVDVASLGLSFYVLGFAMGPLICPLSEFRGRKLPYMISWPLMIASIAPSAFAKNVVVILLFRFFTGCCAACALNNGSGAISDVYHNNPPAQGKGVSFCPLSGPCFGSLVGFFVAASGWHGLWVVRVHLILSAACWPLVFMLKETHGPTLLRRRARALRAQGHANAYSHEEIEPSKPRDIIQNHLLRPAKMFIHEPICQGAGIWISLAYGIVYFFFEVYPVIFITQHNIPFRLCGLMFLPIVAGMFVLIAGYQPLTRLFARLPLPGIVPQGKVLAPLESDLKLVISACVGVPISLFWLGWTSGRETHWIAPALAGVVFGYSMVAIFICFIGYMTRIYKIYSASSSAANTCIRSIVAAGFPVATHRLLDAMGTKWGLSLFGFLSFGMLPIPLIFIRYGDELRARSRYAREADVLIARLSARQDEEKTNVEHLDSLSSKGQEQKQETSSV
ncbi:MFS general substrate transporter [Multifurca ochricompacta]|uniref:MFS general substrate transporter n=1 Tax=Multifurca ochricompacta TaxID=376703 RepID=A0AAD4MAI5_9AGAM|nr:MFS general substrate transporter [Multifurca ochricompacta]